MLQGPVLSLLLQCCSSSSQGVQLLALTALLSLAVVPDNLPAFAKVSPICSDVVCHVHTCMDGCLCTFAAAADAAHPAQLAHERWPAVHDAITVVCSGYTPGMMHHAAPDDVQITTVLLFAWVLEL